MENWEIEIDVIFSRVHSWRTDYLFEYMSLENIQTKAEENVFVRR